MKGQDSILKESGIKKKHTDAISKEIHGNFEECEAYVGSHMKTRVPIRIQGSLQEYPVSCRAGKTTWAA